MLKELVLSLALAAASSVPFLDSPKNATSGGNPREYTLYFSWEWSTRLGPNNNASGFEFSAWYGQETYFSGDTYYVSGDEDIAFDETLEGGYHGNFNYSNFDYEEVYFSLFFDCPISFSDATPEYGFTGHEGLTNNTTWNLSTDQDGDTTIYYISSPEFYSSYGSSPFERGDGNCYVTITYGDTRPYTLTKTFTNCAGYIVGSDGTLSTLPDTYTEQTLQNPYTCRFYASEGYYFDNRSVSNITQNGGIVITDIVYDVALNNDRYTTGFSCSITLPLGNCSLSAVANAHTYTITSELNRCSVSGLPSSYSNTISGTYVFVAASNYGFNKNSVSYEITGANYEVSYSGVLYGDFYQNLTISIQAYFSDIGIRVTAVSYDPVPYQQGFSDGEKKGYEEGKIAGNSYGVWNWLKQAALTTGEFLNIPLLPGFSLGGLLTALAGLVIIWLFIKGFLFKS